MDVLFSNVKSSKTNKKWSLFPVCQKSVPVGDVLHNKEVLVEKSRGAQVRGFPSTPPVGSLDLSDSLFRVRRPLRHGKPTG